MNGSALKTNKDGTLNLYHRTSKENADNIKKTGKFLSKENTNETFFSNHSNGYGEDYGDSIVKIKIHPRYTRINDAFRNGEVHVAVHNKYLSKNNIIK